MTKRGYYFNLSNGHLCKVSMFRFYLRKWFHFPLPGFKLVAFYFYPGSDSNDFVLCWFPIIKVPDLKV